MDASNQSHIIKPLMNSSPLAQGRAKAKEVAYRAPLPGNHLTGNNFSSRQPFKVHVFR
jgi:hypothetical protein